MSTIKKMSQVTNQTVRFYRTAKTHQYEDL